MSENLHAEEFLNNLSMEKKTDLESANNQETSVTLKLTNNQLFIVLLGIVLGVFVAGMDETILSTANEAIIEDLNATGSLTWIATSYLMTTVVFNPLYGKFSDIFGRKVCMLFSLLCFSVGSLGCGLAINIVMLIVFRAIAGIGGGGIITISFIIISDVTTLENRALYLGVINITFAVSSMLGPILGGLIVDHISWRFIFYINLPVTFILALIIIFIMPLPWIEGSFMSKLKRVDYLGVISLSLAIVLLVLGTTWGGKDYPWSSHQVIITLCCSIFSLGAFCYIELKVATEPILPPKMFTHNVIICFIITIVYGLNDFTVIYYLPVYYQTLKGRPPSESGYQLAPFLVVTSISAIATGFIFGKLKTFTIPLRMGTVAMALGSGLLCLISPTLPDWCIILFPIILSLGIGLCMQMAVVGAQASAEPEYNAILASFFNFAYTMGATVGLSIAGAIVNNVLSNFPELIGSGGHGEVHITQSIPLEGQLAYYTALRGIFYFLMGTSLFASISSVFLKYKSLASISTTSSH
jgi:EmrB/QacA subfamily drug resistance transporter